MTKSKVTGSGWVKCEKKKWQSGVRRPHRQLWMCKCEPQISTQKSIIFCKWWVFCWYCFKFNPYTAYIWQKWFKIWLNHLFQMVGSTWSDFWKPVISKMVLGWIYFRAHSGTGATITETRDRGVRRLCWDASNDVVGDRWLSKRMIFVMPNVQSCFFDFTHVFMSTFFHRYIHTHAVYAYKYLLFVFCAMYWSYISHRSL